MTDHLTTAPAPAHFYGYQQGITYMINGYRMYLRGDYWYYVDYPYASPLRAARAYHRTGGGWGIVAKVFGPILLLGGIGLMFGESAGFLVTGALLTTLGLFGTVILLADSMRNHPTGWKVGATFVAAAVILNEVNPHDDWASRTL